MQISLIKRLSTLLASIGVRHSCVSWGHGHCLLHIFTRVGTACCTYRSDTGVVAQHLDHYRGYNFWRFDLTILCGLPERVVEYYIMHGKDHMFAHQTK